MTRGVDDRGSEVVELPFKRASDFQSRQQRETRDLKFYPASRPLFILFSPVSLLHFDNPDGNRFSQPITSFKWIIVSLQHYGF